MDEARPHGVGRFVDVGERLGREGDRPFGLATQLGGVGGIAEQVDVVAARAFGRIETRSQNAMARSNWRVGIGVDAERVPRGTDRRLEGLRWYVGRVQGRRRSPAV